LCSQGCRFRSDSAPSEDTTMARSASQFCVALLLLGVAETASPGGGFLQKSHEGGPVVDDLESEQELWPYAHNKVAVYNKYPPYLMGAVWGADNCQNVQNTSAQWALENGCAAVPTVNNGHCGGDGPLITRTTNSVQTLAICIDPAKGSNAGTPMPQFMDALPVKFTWPVKFATLDWFDFEFTLSNGTKLQPWCATLAPANDNNEGFTVLTQGQYANADSLPPRIAKVTIVSDLVVSNGTHEYNVKGQSWSGGNLEWDLGPVLTIAYVRNYSTKRNPVNEGNTGCVTVATGTTYVLTAVTIGGVTMDGVNPFYNNQTQLFDVEMKDGSYLRRDAFLALADLDGDDFTDICLNVTPDEAAQFHRLHMNCDMSDPCLRFALPKGNKDGKFPCTDTQPQVIAHLDCPHAPMCR